MANSESIKELATALCKFQSEVGTITKDGENPFFKSRYATFENIVATSRPHLKDAGLAFSQLPSGEDELVTILMHVSGEYVSTTTKIKLKDQTAQGHGSALTYAKRYALAAILGLATDDDDDGNAAQPTGVVPQKKTKAPINASKPLPKDSYDTIMEKQLRPGDKLVTGLSKSTGKPWYAIQRGKEKVWLNQSEYERLNGLPVDGVLDDGAPPIMDEIPY